jgi:hypothetical protein
LLSAATAASSRELLSSTTHILCFFFKAKL